MSNLSGSEQKIRCLVELIRIHQATMNTYLLQQSNKASLFDIPLVADRHEGVTIPLLSNDKKLLSWAYLYISDWKSLLRQLNNYIDNVRAMAKELLQSINKEYHLHND